MDIEGFQLKVKTLIAHDFNLLVGGLSLFLIFILYLTTFLSSNTVYSEGFVDISIYIIYTLLLVTLVLLAGSFYLYMIQEDEIEIVTYSADEVTDTLLETPVKAVGSFEKPLKTEHHLPDYRRKFKGFEYLENSEYQEIIGFLSRQHPGISGAIFSVCKPEFIKTLREGFSEEQRHAIAVCEKEHYPQVVLELLDENLARELHPLKKVFIYFSSLKNSEIQGMLRQVNKKELTFALKGMTQALQERFFVNMSPKTEETFREVLSKLSLDQEQKIEGASKKLHLLAKQLREDGKMRAQNKVTG